MQETNEHLLIANLLKVIDLPEVNAESRQRMLKQICAYTVKYAQPSN